MTSTKIQKTLSVLYIYGMSVKLLREYVDNELVYMSIGIDEEGYREILDFYIGASESSALWEEVLLNLKSRGLEEVLLGVMDSLSELKDAFLKVYPKADVQRCIVHRVRNTITKVRKKHLNEIIEDLKTIYNAPDTEYAKKALKEFCDKWGQIYPKITQSWWNE
ncbi:hypothetical protein BBF96_13515 [Anoxybacter fermentans]|uniref:Mutator family transposase n=1 Tax=Anoxybacter fermentans TaxID=1323375 RepID=A0A3S9T1A6_9FIRM|nr:hypothetical protein BBF96_13515 [Anoxybacter fermentans]